MSRRYKKKHKRPSGYRSGLEEVVARMLPKARTTFEGEKLVYFLQKNYIPDFIIKKPDGSKVYLEVKGYLRYEDQVKMKAVRIANPDLDIRFYFPKDQKVHTSQMLNSEWCAKWGYPCAIGKIPRGWFR
jgi:predicted nuclease of restriction endonuclease-like RecB superfamily